ncbi:MAG: hypothetical protein R3260_00720 [Pseudomonas sp.]|nr:hypothetical protein [Pseudomonas sp.]
MPNRSPSVLISRGTLIASALLFLAGAATGAAIAIWQAEPAATEAEPAQSNKREQRKIYPRIVDVA